MIEIKPYGPANEELHKQFALKHWTKRKRITPEYIYWKFRGVPGKELLSFILAIEEGQVIGQLGLVPCIVDISGKKVDAQWACDLMVDHDYRGKGIAKMLYEYACLIKPLTLGSDASPAATISMKRAGFISLIGPWKFFFPLWLGEITKLKGYNSVILSRIRNPFIYLFQAWRFLRKGKQKFRQKSISSYIDFVNKVSSEKKLKVFHDYSFTHWRYPAFKDYYKGVQMYADSSSSFFSFYTDKELLIVTEWSGKTRKAYLDIWSEILFLACCTRVLRIKILANSALETATLSFSGCLKFRTRTDIIYYTTEKELHDQLKNEYFYYTYLDSDENI
jgi:GNAT superfamily N-acetyltransferase